MSSFLFPLNLKSWIEVINYKGILHCTGFAAIESESIGESRDDGKRCTEED